MRADLHLHTTASDGLLTPARMVREARLAGMNIIAITDHDTVSGVREALDAGVREGVRVLPGLELSVGGEEEIHLLAYGVRPEHPGLLALLEGLLVRRQARMEEMLRRLEALGMPVPREEACAPDSPFMGRMNLARAMTARSYCASPAEAFSRWLNAGRPAYVPKEPIGVPEGVRRLRALGAVVCLAHPGRLRMEESALLARLPGWTEAGLEGMEAYHPSHRDPERYARMARRHGLLVTGGSDCHGRRGERSWIGEATAGWHSAQEDVAALQSRMTERITKAESP
ncbi:MAG TPA: PHP domain-containing protein [Candidatus Avichristensenella intestinipullorum]|uniref:PHP domain-containing protein n=1 Tax=Candidatus Avichristensenella intestinipullorum TaxID=2840693 RepID=A0A9D0YUK9_9FIRM|nr:PHP domain-containing protein [Candidatus Avichristensenella intestinipullorum]